jgi:hypothetical protein
MARPTETTTIIIHSHLVSSLPRSVATAITMAAPTLSLYTFPHPVLTPIIGKPTTATTKLLQCEIFANARAIHSTRGGGANGHLSVCMPNPAYLAHMGQAFTAPIHPGAQPTHAIDATSTQISTTNRQYG